MIYEKKVILCSSEQAVGCWKGNGTRGGGGGGVPACRLSIRHLRPVTMHVIVVKRLCINILRMILAGNSGLGPWSSRAGVGHQANHLTP